MPPGSYLHIGLENQLRRISSVIKNEKLVQIDIGIDGLPLYKSSMQTLWPILAKIHPSMNTEVMLVGVFLGKQKPNNSNTFLNDLANELSNLLKNGLNINGNIVAIKLRAFICDTPARAFVCQTIGHNALQGCGRCLQVGKRVNYTTVYSTEKGELRSNDSFLLRTHTYFHKNPNEKSVLEEIGVKMITQFPLDIMHLVDLGVTKKVLQCIVKGDIKDRKLNKDELEHISMKLLSLYNFVPAEFARKPRGLLDLCRWKAVEFRQFLLYTGIFVLKNVVSESLFDHFLVLHCAYRILVDDKNFQSNINVAGDMLQYFVELFPAIYKADKVSYNVHSLLHLTECVNDMGFPHTFSAYAFEFFFTKIEKGSQETHANTATNK